LNEDNSGLLLAVRDPGSCFASRIPLLLRNGATKYQATISIVRQAPRDYERIQNAGNLPYNCFRHFFEKWSASYDFIWIS